MSHAGHPSGSHLTDARRPCVLLILPGDGERAVQHWSTEWVVVDDPWLALAEALHQRREAATRAGWGLQPVGRPYVFSRGRIDGPNGDAFRAALARWVPEAQLVELEPDATIESIERQLAAIGGRLHPLRRNEPSAPSPTTDAPRHAPRAAEEAARSDGADERRDPDAPIPIRHAPPNVWSQRRTDPFPSPAAPKSGDATADESHDDDPNDADESRERRHAVTPEELSLLLESMDDLMDGEEEMPES